MGKLEGKIAIVTGSGQGIGAEIARMFAREGATVVVDDIVAERANRTVKEIKDAEGKAVAAYADISNRAQVDKMVKDTISQFGKIDILVNDAINRRNKPFVELTQEDWDIALGVGLKGYFNCTQAVAPYMMERKYGKIVSLASVAGIFHGQVTHATYAGVKGGLVQMMQVISRELGPYNINVNCIAPGRVDTGVLTFRSEEEKDKSMKQRASVTVLGRVAHPVDIANCALFLVDDASSFVTGAVYRVDGGRIDGM